MLLLAIVSSQEDKREDSRSYSCADTSDLGHAPPGASNFCAIPKYDCEGTTLWCYCADVNSSAWGYCGAPTVSTPTQINLQVAGPDALIASFVTYAPEPSTPVVPLGELSVFANMSDAVTVRGESHVYTEPEGLHRVYTFNFIPFVGLRQDTDYYYRLNGGTQGALWSSVLSLHSLYDHTHAQPTRLAIFGDIGLYEYNNFEELVLETGDNNVDFLAVLGDHAYNLMDAVTFRMRRCEEFLRLIPRPQHTQRRTDIVAMGTSMPFPGS